MGQWDVLERHFAGLTAAEVDAELAAVPAARATPSSAAAVAYLAEHGGPDLNMDTDPGRGSVRQRRALTAAKTLADTLASALTLEQAAQRLGVSRSRVSHRITEDTLWAFTVAGRRYLPCWQFTDDGTLPGLVRVVPAIPRGLHPLALEAFMTTARPDFDGVSPVQWLESGGDPGLISDWLTGMAHG